MAGYISKGLTLGYKAEQSGSSYTNLTNLQEIPDIGGTTESIEITCLSDGAHMYMNGIKDYGDSLDFTFLYEPTQWGVLNAMTEAYWELGIPDGASGAVDTKATWHGSCSVKLNGVGVNEALTYTLSIKPDSEIVFA